MRARWYRTAVSAAVLMTSSLLLAGSAFAVTITSFTPTVSSEEVPNGCAGAFITITGRGFATEGPIASVRVSFNGTPAGYVEVGSDTTIYTRVPKGATNGAITVTTAAGSATSTQTYLILPCQAFEKVATPAAAAAPVSSAAKASISTFTPAKAKAGAKVTITGAKFTDATTVKIGGVKATFKVVSGTKITATVPAKAKSGKISVTTAAGTSTSSKSFVKA